MNSGNQPQPVSADGAVALTATVSMAQSGQRLDKVVAELFPQYSRSRLQTWLKQERILVNGVAAT
uniref:S4 domain-containing protein n=1 Tax=Limnobacter sp. TaxID=2003368 RepID=UPI0035114745